MATGAVIARIISQYSDKGSKAAQKDMAKLTKEFDKFGKRAVKSVGLAAAATAGLAIKLGKDAVQGAMADQKQQAALAMALRNTTNATDEAIDANSRYLDSLELQVAIDNEQLIPALQTLVQGTRNLSKAQQLLALATDVSAASGKDLGTVSTALSRAYNGNFTALNRLGIPLDQAKVKAKDFLGIQKDLAEVSKGQASAAANTFAGKLTTLQLRFNQITERVGYALIPVLEKMVDRLENDVFPAFEKFIRMNQQDIVNAFETTLKLAEDFARAMIKLADILKDLEPLLKILATGILSIIGYVKLLAATAALKGFLSWMVGGLKFFRAEMVLIGPVTKQVADEFSFMGFGIKKLGREMKGFKEAAKLSAKFKILGRALFLSMSPALLLFGKIAIAIAAIYAAYRGLKWLLDKFARDDRKRVAAQKIALQKEKEAADQLNATYNETIRTMIKRGQSSNYVTEKILADFKTLEDQTKAAKEQAAKDAADAARNARLLAEQIADEKKRLYIKGLETKAANKLRTLNRNLLTDEKKMAVQLAAIKKKNAQLDKAGIKLTDPDEMTAIQMEAIYQNLVKNGRVLLAEATKQQKAADELKQKAAEEYNKTLMRQADIVQYLDKLRANDIVVIGYLANKWEMTTEAADMYIKSVLAIGEVKIDDAGILSIRMAWGMSENQARKYLEFTAAIKAGHGNIGKEKLEELGRKWFSDSDSPYKAAKEYEEALGVLADHEVGRDEIDKLVESWNKSPDAVAAYLLEVGKPFTLTGDAKLILSAEMVGKIAGAWDAARIALMAYLAAAKGFKFDIPSTVPTVPVVPPVIPPKIPIVPPSHDGKIVSDATEAAVKVAEQIATLTELRKDTTPGTGINFLLKEHIDALKDNTSTVSNLPVVDERTKMQAMGVFDTPIPATFDVGSFRMAEEKSMAGLPSTPSFNDYDERFRFQSFNSPTSSAGSNIGGGNLMAGSTVNVTLNVAGSVTTEQDLVQTVRNGLLASQYNGNQLLLEAI